MNDLWDEVTSNDWIDPNVVVAVIDTGIKTDHPDLNVLPGVDMTDDVNPDDPTDFSGHGTHVAGTIGARRDLGEDQVVGIAPGVKILPIKVFSDAGTGSIADLIRGIRYAIDAEVDIINMSLSYPNHDAIIEALVEEAEAKGIFVVAAASNDSNLWLQDETFDQDGDFDTEESDRQKVGLYYPSAHPTVLLLDLWHMIWHQIHWASRIFPMFLVLEMTFGHKLMWSPQARISIAVIIPTPP